MRLESLTRRRSSLRGFGPLAVLSIVAFLALLEPNPIQGTPESVSRGIDWLLSRQNPSGSWGPNSRLELLETTACLDALRELGVHSTEVTRAVTWLAAKPAPNTDYLARKILSLIQANQAVDTLVSTLQTQGISLPGFRPGWGVAAFYGRDPLSTSLALEALRRSQASGVDVGGILTTLLDISQNADGGWGMGAGTPSDVSVTSRVLVALEPYRGWSGVQPKIDEALSWLLAQQQADGGFGDGTSTVYETALSLLALNTLGLSPDGIQRARDFLVAQQGADGSWNGSVYQTALAVKAIGVSISEPPELSPIGGKSVSEGALLEMTVAATDRTPADAVTLTAAPLPANATFTSTPGNPASGIFSFRPDFTQAGRWDVTFTATDSFGLSSSEIVPIVVLDLPNPEGDSDGDGLSDGAEVALGTDPYLADTDGDGVSDGDEARLGSDPKDPASLPNFYLINEVMFNPQGGPPWVEIVNLSRLPLNVTGWDLTRPAGEVRSDFYEGSLAPGEHRVVELEENSLAAEDALLLRDARGRVVDAVVWGQASPSSPPEDWRSGEFVPTAGGAPGQSIGRDGRSRDAHAEIDWYLLPTRNAPFAGSPDAAFPGPKSSAFNSMAAGDINGDGIEDVMVGLSAVDGMGSAGSQSGAVYVTFGSKNPVQKPLTEADLIVLSEGEGDRLGWAVASGDVNGDGVDDLLVGAPAHDPGSGLTDLGAVYVFFGHSALAGTLSASRANVKIKGLSLFDNLGSSVAAADVNGDGIDDLLCGAPYGNRKGTVPQTGEAYIVFGSNALAGEESIDVTIFSPATATGDSVGATFGWAMAASDVNGDGFQDLCIGAQRADGAAGAGSRAGEMHGYFGRASWPSELSASNFSFLGTIADGRAGRKVAVGDFTGDGLDDIAVAAPWAAVISVGEGQVALIYGERNLSGTQTADVLIHGVSRSYLGDFLALRDINGDQLADLLIKVPFARPEEARLVYGRADLSGPWDVTAVTDWLFKGPHRGSGAADFSPLALGNVNGDHFPDALFLNAVLDASGNWTGNELVWFTFTPVLYVSPGQPNHLPVSLERPDIQTVPNVRFNEDATFALDLTPYVSGVSDPKSIRWNFTGGMEVRVQVDAAQGLATFSSTPDWFGTELITVSATSSTMLEDSKAVTVTVDSVNDAPRWSPIPVLTVEEDSGGATVALLSFLSDPDHPLGELTLSVSDASGLAASVGALTGDLTLLPLPDFAGQASVQVTATDPAGGSISQTVQMTVTPVNDPPVLQPIPDQEIFKGSAFVPLSLDSFVSDPDDPDEDLTWSATGHRELAVTIDPSTRVARVNVPHPDWAGEETVTFTVTDPGGRSGSDSVIFRVVVQPVNELPKTTLVIGDPRFGSTPTYVTGATLFSFEATDDGGVDYTEAQIGAGEWFRVTGPITLSGEGLTTLSYRSVDRQGGVEPPHSATLFVDNTPPVTELRRSGAQFVLRAEDRGAGVAVTHASFDGNPAQSITEPLDLREGQVLEFWSVDRLGNTEATHPYTHRPSLADPLVEAIPSPRSMPLIRLSGQSDQVSVPVQWEGPRGVSDSFDVPVDSAGRFSHHLTLRAGSGLYVFRFTGATQDPLPIEVVLQAWDRLLDPAVPVTVTDLDGDGGQELLAVSTEGQIHAWGQDGDAVAGWPIVVGEPLTGAVAVEDLNADREKEIIASTTKGRVMVFGLDGVERWSVATGSPELLPPVLVRIGLSDPPPFGIFVGAGDGQLLAWDGQGNLLAGWPVRLSAEPVVGVAVADVTGDGQEEVIAAWRDQLAILNASGEPLSGWPVAVPQPMVTGPVVGDLANLGQGPQVLVADAAGAVRAYRFDGTPWPNWPVFVNGSIQHLLLGNLGGDKTLETFAADSSGRIFAWSSDGFPISGWPALPSSQKPLSGVRLAPVGQPSQELVVAVQDGRFLAFNEAGQSVEPPADGAFWFMAQAPVLADLDGDMDLEWVTLASQSDGTRTQVYVWDDPRPLALQTPDWPQWAWNPRHAGHHPRINRGPVLAPIGKQTVGEGQLLGLSVSATDPEGDSLRYSVIGLPARATFKPWSSSWLFRWYPWFDQAGTYWVTFLASDGDLTDREVVRITVQDVPLNITQLIDFPDPFSPNGDGRNDATVFTIRLNHTADWQLDVADAAGGLVRAFGRKHFVIRQLWDGKDSTGRLVPDGTYTYTFKATDAGGNSISRSSAVVVDTVPPVVSGLSDAPDPFRPSTWQMARIYFTVSEPVWATLRVYNSAGVPVRTIRSYAFPFGGNVPYRIVWNGRNHAGVVVPPGVYTYKLWVEDRAGNPANPFADSGTITVR